MKKNILFVAAMLMLFAVSCSDFLDTEPKDALSPTKTWKTEADAQSFAVGCYSGWLSGSNIMYLDCASDIGYNNFPWEGWTNWGNGTFSAADPGASYYSFGTIRRCNDFLEHVEKIKFGDDKVKKDLVAQIRAIRAWSYFEKNFWYGGVPIISSYESAEEARVSRKTEEEVKKFVFDELDALIPDLNEMPSAAGRVAKGSALAMKMRSALYYNDYKRAKDAAKEIIDMKKYELDKDYSNLFTLKGKSSKEIIYSIQYLESVAGFSCGNMYNNEDGGWSSIVPTQNLVDMYEMKDGLTKEESKSYDPVHPFAGRDPRMAMTILYPGQNWQAIDKKEVILNTLDKIVDGKENNNYPTKANNSSKTSLTWAKYLVPMNQYADIWDNSLCPIVFRYAEVLLSFAEASNELSGPSEEVYDAIDKIRTRVGMPKVDRAKYATKETLRELIRRERTVELAGEGLRRADILRWKDASGKMLAETVLNGDLLRIVGKIDYGEKDPYKRAVIDVKASVKDRKIETRIFKPFNRYLPIPQGNIDNNPNLKQNEGY